MLILCLTQGSTVDGMAAVVRSVKVLCLSGVNLCLDVFINLMKCFPNLEELSIKVPKCSCIYISDHLQFTISMIVFKARLTVDAISLFTLLFRQQVIVCQIHGIKQNQNLLAHLTLV